MMFTRARGVDGLVRRACHALVRSSGLLSAWSTPQRTFAGSEGDQSAPMDVGASSSPASPTPPQQSDALPTRRRRVRPTDASLAALFEEEEEKERLQQQERSMAHQRWQQHGVAKGIVLPGTDAFAASFMQAEIEGSDEGDEVNEEALRDEEDLHTRGGRFLVESEDVNGGAREQSCPQHSCDSNASTWETHVDHRVLLEDTPEPLTQRIAINDMESVDDADPSAVAMARERLRQRHEVLYQCPAEDLVESVGRYLRTTTNPKLVSAEEEYGLFPVLMDRLHELHVSQMLDIVDSHWARSTLVRYGTTVKDLIRDRIVLIATTAADQLNREPHVGASHGFSLTKSGRRGSNEGGDNNGEDGPEEEEGEEDCVYVHEKEAVEQLRRCDAVLANAAAEMTAETALRCVVVMGCSGGRRKRDLAFFQVMGSYVAYFINAYKDPHDLTRVLTAFGRAKIVPPPSFLALICRRLPVLNKRTPLEPLACYRAMVNLARMQHDQMSAYRFLADCMLASMEEKLAAERARRRAMAEVPQHSEKDHQVSQSVSTVAETDEASLASFVLAPPLRVGDAVPGALLVQATKSVQAREWLRHVTGLKPTMFTRWLAVLGQFGAPHQQYLRPLVQPVIVPMLPFLPPPSFSRLLRAALLFGTTDAELLDPIVSYMCHQLAPQGRLVCGDVLLLLQLLGREDTPVPANWAELVEVCVTAFTGHREQPTQIGKNEEVKEGIGEGGDRRRAGTTFLVRPGDMVGVAQRLTRIQQKPSVPLESLAPLVTLMDHFAGRFSALLEVGVASLVQVDAFLEACARQLHPDTSGSVARLEAQRRRLEEEVGEEGYYALVDVDVRNTFVSIATVNGTNTYGSYRPLPGPLQVDFREALTRVSAFDLLEAIDLYERVCPGALRATPKRFLTRSVLNKLGRQGEEVVASDGTLVLRPPRELLLTREDVQRFVELLQRTPLTPLRTSPVVWQFVQAKAQRLQLPEVVKKAHATLEAAV